MTTLQQFFDDILIYSKTWEDNFRHLDEVLSFMEAQSLYAKASNCESGLTKILYLGNVINAEYLGHVINVEEVSVHQEKIRTILD